MRLRDTFCCCYIDFLYKCWNSILLLGYGPLGCLSVGVMLSCFLDVEFDGSLIAVIIIAIPITLFLNI